VAPERMRRACKSIAITGGVQDPRTDRKEPVGQFRRPRRQLRKRATRVGLLLLDGEAEAGAIELAFGDDRA